MTLDQVFVLAAEEETIKNIQRFVVRAATSIPEIKDKLSPVAGKSITELLQMGYSPEELGLVKDKN